MVLMGALAAGFTPAVSFCVPPRRRDERNMRPPDSPQRGTDRERRRPSPEQEPPRLRIPWWYLMLGLLLLLLIYWAASRAGRQEISYGEFRRLLKAGKVERCVLKPDKIEGELRTRTAGGEPVRFVTLWLQDDEDIYKLLDEAKPSPEYSVETNRLQTLILFWVLPIIAIVLVWRLFLGRMNPARGVMDFTQSRARLFMQKEVDVSFDDVAGIDECKEELEEVIEFLRNPRKFTSLGGKIPKGVLLVGAPGTGKTLLARAVAGEAGVPFFSLSGSDFVELFVGVGAARVRDLFEQANRHAPCIIFIDELDALGKARGAGLMGGHDEREQTLNALLVQMDGFEPTKGVILLSATNRPEMLDPALLRPGRFDRQIAIARPDLRGREEILKLHSREVKLSAHVDMRKIAAQTPGFVGADLANLINEGALLAARRGKQAVEMAELQESIERVVAGLERRNRLMNEEEKKIVAHHEAGHALAACLLPGADPVRKVSMIARGVAGLGYTMQMPLEDRYLLRRSELLDRLCVLLAGRAAEEVSFNEVSTGAHNDLGRATELAREMVVEFGMSEELGVLAFPKEAASPFAPDLGYSRPWSERTNRDIDKAIKQIIEEQHTRAGELLSAHKDALDAIAAGLMEKEALGEEELKELLARFGIEVRGAPAEREPDQAEAAAQETPDDSSEGEADAS